MGRDRKEKGKGRKHEGGVKGGKEGKEMGGNRRTERGGEKMWKMRKREGREGKKRRVGVHSLRKKRPPSSDGWLQACVCLE